MTTDEQIAATRARLVALRKRARREERDRRDRIGKMVLDLFPDLPEPLPEVQAYLERLAVTARREHLRDENPPGESEADLRVGHM